MRLVTLIRVTVLPPLLLNLLPGSVAVEVVAVATDNGLSVLWTRVSVGVDPAPL